MSSAPTPTPQTIADGKPAPPAQPQAGQRPAIDHLCVPGQRQRAHAATNMILGAAHAWWASRRPRRWTLHQHLQNPAVNACGEDERRLAQAVAEWILAASVPGTQPGMPFEPRTDAAGNVLGWARARTPLEAAVARSGLTVLQLARHLDIPERALHRWCAGANRPRGAYRVLVEKWMAEQQALAEHEEGGA